MTTEFITREVNNCFTGMFFRNYELLVLIGFTVWGSILALASPPEVFIFIITISTFGGISTFVPGVLRGRFIRKGLRYHIYKDKIELYVAGELYRTRKIKGTTYKVRWWAFGKCIEFKPGTEEMLGSDFAFGIASDTLKGTAEMIIYRCENVKEVLEFIET